MADPTVGTRMERGLQVLVPDLSGQTPESFCAGGGRQYVMKALIFLAHAVPLALCPNVLADARWVLL